MRSLLTLLLLAGPLLVSAGCDGLFDAENTNVVDEDDIIRSGYPGALLLARGPYDRLANVMDNVAVYGAVATDEANAHSGQVTFADLDTGEWTRSSPEVNFAYSGLQDARGQATRFLDEFLDRIDVADGFPASSGVSVEDRTETFRDYATLVRGWATLYLGLLFEQVNFDQQAPVSPEAAIRLAIADLEAVRSGSGEATFEGVALKEAAATLLARAYLQLGDYPAAAAAAQNGYAPTTAGTGQITAVFTSSAFNAINGNAIFSTVGDEDEAEKVWSMTAFYATQGETDARVAVDSTTAGGDAFIQSADNSLEERGVSLGYVSPLVLEKYLAPSVQQEPVRLLAWQDTDLTRAEALIRTGDVSGGVALINGVRAAASQPDGRALPAVSASGAEAALALVRAERRLEFAVENADRFVTLRRFGVVQEYSGGPLAFPIPDTEL